jgi:hypothetical protein
MVGSILVHRHLWSDFPTVSYGSLHTLVVGMLQTEMIILIFWVSIIGHHIRLSQVGTYSQI